MFLMYGILENMYGKSHDMNIVAANIAGNSSVEWGLILDMNMITMTWEKYIP